MNWGIKIIVAYVCFGALVASLVIISMKQDISLVAKDYYKQEIAYQDQIERISNYKNLEKTPEMSLDKANASLILSFPKEIKEVKSGSLLLFRPSKASMDQEFELRLNDDLQQIFTIGHLSTGLWKVRLSWLAGDKEFYNEQIIVL